LLERVVHGVYRDAGAPVSNYELLKALWLSTNPKLYAEERLMSPDVIIGGTTATWLWNFGDLEPYPYQFYSPIRRQTQQSDFQYIRMDFCQDDFALIDGLPVAQVKFAVADLIKRGYDPSHIETILLEAGIHA
jgi:hypothetical protein